MQAFPGVHVACMAASLSTVTTEPSDCEPLASEKPLVGAKAEPSLHPVGIGPLFTEKGISSRRSPLKS